MFYKTNIQFDHHKILETFKNIVDYNTPYSNQWTFVGKEDINDGTGKLNDLSDAEENYNKLLTVYHGTYLEEVYDKIQTHINSFRVRFMQLGPKTTYSYHVDPTPRFHIPLSSNEHSWMIIDKKVFEFDNGYLYLIDTTRPHTAINLSMCDPRIHIVGGYTLKDQTLI